MSQLVMKLRSLAGHLEPCTPQPYVLRTFEPGDEADMAECFRSGFGGEWAAQKVMDDMVQIPSIGPDRIFVAVHDERVVATASAWFRTDRYPRDGYLHMVSVSEKHRGRGLGRAVSLAALRCFKSAGFDGSVLHTDDFRKPALALYLGLGFRPALCDADHRERWRVICEEMSRPDVWAEVEKAPQED